MNYKLLTIKKSHNKDKKLDAVFENKDTGREKTISFGASGMSDFTKHKDTERKERYLNRHKKNENWDNPLTAGALSRFVLWGPTTSIRKNVNIFKQKFGL